MKFSPKNTLRELLAELEKHPEIMDAPLGKVLKIGGSREFTEIEIHSLFPDLVDFIAVNSKKIRLCADEVYRHFFDYPDGRTTAKRWSRGKFMEEIDFLIKHGRVAADADNQELLRKMIKRAERYER